MTGRKFTRLQVITALLPILITCAVAKTGTCDSTPLPACSHCTGTPCVIWIQFDSSNRVAVSLTNGGPHVDAICVDKGQSVTWREADAVGGNFDVEFGVFSNPFSGVFSNSFKGSSGTDRTGTISTNPSHACYRYSVEQCSSASGCSSLDPKVVINPVQAP